MGAAREHGIIDALTHAGIDTVADTAYQGGRPAIRTPQRRRLDPDTGRYRRLSGNQKAVNAALARQRGPGERVNTQLKNWRILRKIRSSPSHVGKLVAAVQTGDCACSQSRSRGARAEARTPPHRVGQLAAWYASTTDFEIRPRSFTL